MKDEKMISRRSVLSSCVSLPLAMTLIGAATVHAQNASKANPSDGAVPKPVAEDDPTAKAIGYVQDGTKAKREDKGGVAAKDQSCSNCQLYTKGAELKGKEVGKCLMLPSGVVFAKGWCKSWVKKA